MYVGDPVADAIYAEKEALGTFGEAHNAVNLDGGTAAAEAKAQERYDDFVFAYDYCARESPGEENAMN